MNHRATVSSAALFLIVACAKQEAPPPPPAPPGPPAVVRITARDFSFEMQDTLTTGPTTFVLSDSGTELHHAQIVRFEEGKTVADLSSLKPGTPPPSWLVMMGGPNPSAPGGSEISTTVDLVPGNYALLCFIPSPAPDNRPHFTKGMVHPFTVIPTNDKRESPAPHFTLSLADYSFNFSAPLPAGQHDIKVVNSGPQEHEVVIVKLDAGKKAGDLLQWFGAGMKGPPPGTPVGGTAGMNPNGESIIHLNLTPGEYGMYCFVEDAKDGKMHVEHGMVSQFSVQ